MNKCIKCGKDTENSTGICDFCFINVYGKEINCEELLKDLPNIHKIIKLNNKLLIELEDEKEATRNE